MKTIVYLIACVSLTFSGEATATTVKTGDRIDGVAVIDKLDVADLPAGAESKFFFRVIDQSIGQGWYVPVIVIKGAKSGARLLVTAGIHGDELNGIAVIHQLAASIDPKALSGTLVMVPGLNTAGLLHSTRGFTSSVIGTNGDNLNRAMPGSEDGGPSSRYAARLWSQLFMGNADYAIDLHTQSRGGSYPGYVFAQTSAARRIADMLRPDVIGMDPGIEGTVENMLNPAGIPAVTYELGSPERFDDDIIGRAAKGIRNVMIDRAMLTGKPDLSDPPPYVGNVVTDIVSSRGGFAHTLVRLGQDVEPGDVLATISNPFGEITATITAPLAGHVLSVITDPRIEPGVMVVRLISWSDNGVCHRDGCPNAVQMIKAN